MKIKLLIIVLYVTLYSFSQNIYIPFKVDNQFGISDEKGILKLEPQFDYINISDYQDNYFLAFKENKSSCIFQNKIIIKDKDYFGYYPYNDLIVAVEKANKKTTSYYSHDNEQCHLYNNKGKLILPDYYMFITVFEVQNQPITDNVLLLLLDMNSKYSLVVYNKKQMKIIQTFIDTVNDVEYSFEYIASNQSFTVDYVLNDKRRRITLQFDGKSYKILLDETLEPKKKGYDDYFNDVVAMDIGEDIRMKNVTTDKSHKIEVKSIEKSYNISKKKQFTWNSKWVLPNETTLVIDNNKFGVKKYNSTEMLVPTEYDAIYSCDFYGHHYYGYILKKDSKYGIYVTGLRVKGNGFFIPNNFNHIPLIDQFDYVRKDFHVIALYDNDGHFLHYANQLGKEYRN